MTEPDLLDVMDAVDRRLDPLVPTTPVPPDLALRGSRLRRRRTSTRALVAAAVVVTAAGLGATTLKGNDVSAPVATDTSPATTTAPPTPEPTLGTGRCCLPQPTHIPEGMHLVGFEGLALAVPDEWQDLGDQCAGSEDGPVLVLGVPGGCARTSFVRVEPTGSVPSAAALRMYETEIRNGLEIYRLDDCGPYADCDVSQPRSDVIVPDLGVQLFISSYQRSTVDAIADSVRVVPEGLVAVPVLPSGTTAAVRQVEQAGLIANTPTDEIRVDATYVSTPPPGTLVPRGTAVLLLVGDG